MAMIEHPTLDMERQLATQGCDVVIGCTTGGAIGMTNEERLAALPVAKPELASSNGHVTSPPRKCRPVSPIPNC